jgi:hypothetical protein
MVLAAGDRVTYELVAFGKPGYAAAREMNNSDWVSRALTASPHSTAHASRLFCSSAVVRITALHVSYRI